MLVSNHRQLSATELAQTVNQWAQSFTTGTSPHGYLLSGIGLRLGAIPAGYAASSFSVAIWSARSGVPGGELHPLTTPATLRQGLNTFASTASDVTLAADTKYFVVFADGTGTVPIGRTASTSEDRGKASGWRIGDARLFLRQSDTDWSMASPSSTLFKVKVEGFAKGPDTTAPTLQSATVTRDTLVLAYDEALDEASTAGGGRLLGVGGRRRRGGAVARCG